MKSDVKKIFIFLIYVVLMLLFVGCSSTQEIARTVTEDESLKKADINKSYSSKILGKDDIPMPEWVVGRNISTEDVHYAVGMSDYPVERIAINKAEDDARNQLAEWVSTYVNEKSTGYLGTSGESYAVATEAYETVYSQKSEAVLSACTREHIWISKEGNVYVLMSIPVVNVIDQFGFKEEKNKTNSNINQSDAVAAMKNALTNM